MTENDTIQARQNGDAAKDGDLELVAIPKLDVRFSDGAFAFEFPGVKLARGGIYRLTGGNGSGKSTLLSYIEQNLHKTMFPLLMDQNYSSLIFPYHDICWNITLPLIIRKQSRKRIQEAYESLAERFNLELAGDRLAMGLSGGEQRLIVLARFLLASPQIVLLDEPFANLDIERVKKAWELIVELAGQGSIVIIVSHETGPIPDCHSLLTFKGVHESKMELLKINGDAYD